MNPITKLLREQRKEFEKKIDEIICDEKNGEHNVGYYKNIHMNDHTTAQQQLIDVIVESIKLTSSGFTIQEVITLLQEAKKEL